MSSSWRIFECDRTGVDDLALQTAPGDKIVALKHRGGEHVYGLEHLRRWIARAPPGMPRCPHTQQPLPVDLLLQIDTGIIMARRMFELLVCSIFELEESGEPASVSVRMAFSRIAPIASGALPREDRRLFTRLVSESIRTPSGIAQLAQRLRNNVSVTVP